MEHESKWLADLKVGDEVIVVRWGTPRLATITRSTKLHVVAQGFKFRRKNGMSVEHTGGQFKISIGYIVSKESRPDLLKEAMR